MQKKLKKPKLSKGISIPFNKRMSNILFDGEIDGYRMKFTWSPNPTPPSSPHPLTSVSTPSALVSEEVWELVKEWYKNKKSVIPIAEVKACKEAIEAEKEEKCKPIEQVDPGPMKPEYGSPSFWADYWAKKKASGWVSKADQKKQEKEAKEKAKAEKEKAKEEAKKAKEEAKKAKETKSKKK